MTKIYGLIEKTSFSSLFEMAVIEGKHPELEEIVANTKNSKVGIELVDSSLVETKTFEEKGIRVEIPKIYTDIYNKLKENNEICFVDEHIFVPIAIEFAKKHKHEKPTELDKFKYAKKQEYVMGIKRTEVIAEKIKTMNPEIAFIGAQHAYDLHRMGFEGDIFIECATNLQEAFESVDAAYKFSVSEDELKETLDDIELVFKLNPAASIPKDDKLMYDSIEQDRTVLTRLNNLVEKGELLSQGKKPDFIGSWCLNLPLYGYFEMYITKRDGNRVEGTISDFMGDATFRGTLTKKGFNFTKEYTNVLDNGAIREPIPYELRVSGLPMYNRKVLEGTYKTESGSGEVVLIHYEKGLEQKFVEMNNKREITNSLIITEH